MHKRCVIPHLQRRHLLLLLSDAPRLAPPLGPLSCRQPCLQLAYEVSLLRHQRVSRAQQRLVLSVPEWQVKQGSAAAGWQAEGHGVCGTSISKHTADELCVSRAQQRLVLSVPAVQCGWQG